MTMALAVAAAQTGKRRNQIVFLLLTIALGSVFLGVKVVEYHDKWVHHLVPGLRFEFRGAHGREAQIFFCLYFAMTGMHALHMIVGIGILSGLVGHGVAWALLARVLHAGRVDRPLLALRGYRLDLPIPAALSDQGEPMKTRGRSHREPIKSSSPRCCCLTLVTVDVAFFNVGMMNLPIALAGGHDEGDAGDPVLYARTLRAVAGLAAFAGAGFVWLLILLGITDERLARMRSPLFQRPATKRNSASVSVDPSFPGRQENGTQPHERKARSANGITARASVIPSALRALRALRAGWNFRRPGKDGTTEIPALS